MMFRAQAWVRANFILFICLAGCNAPPQAEAPAPPLPKQLCEKAKQALDKGSSQGGFEYDGQGSATIEEAAWLAMNPNDRDSFAQLLAFNVACSEPHPPREETVVIKSEFGRVLTQRTIETNVDISRLLHQ